MKMCTKAYHLLLYLLLPI